MALKWTGDRLPAGSVGPRQVRYLPTTRSAPPPIPANRYARNGKHPSAHATNAINEACNHAAMYRTKEVFRAVGGIGAAGITTSYGAGSRTRWYGAFSTSPYTHALCAIVVMVPQDSGYDENAYAKLELATNAAGTPAVVTQTFEHGASPTGPTTANGWPYVKMITKYVDVDPSTDYYLTISDVDYGRILSATVFELSSLSENNGGYLAQNITSMTPVVDVFREKQATIQRQLWKRAGATVFHWFRDDGAAEIRTTATFLNIVDMASTTPGSSTPGYTLDMTGRDRLSQTSGVPCVMKAYGKVSSGSTGTIELCDSTGTAVATISSGWTTTATWQSVAFYLPATVDKYDLRLKGNGTNALSIYAVSVYEYEA